MLTQDLQTHAQYHAADSHPLERLHLILNVELVPAEVVHEAAQQEEAHLQALQENLQVGPHLLRTNILFKVKYSLPTVR